MKVISILPKAHMNLIRDNEMFMALAQYHGDADYVAIHKQLVSNGGYVILDNGVAEGSPMTIQQVVDMALEIGAQEIILPDVFMAAEETLESTFDAIEYLNEKGLRKNFKLMGVPQGTSMEEWLWCCQQMLAMDVDVIGIPKNLIHVIGRDGRLSVLKEMGFLLKGREIHLLGVWTTALEVTMIASAIEEGLILPIRSVDSNLPWAFAMENLNVGAADKPAIKIDMEQRFTDDTLLRSNILAWEAAGKIFKPEGNVTHI